MEYDLDIKDERMYDFLAEKDEQDEQEEELDEYGQPVYVDPWEMEW